MTPPSPQSLQPASMVDSHHPAVVAFAREHARGADERERAVALYYAVRDGFRYDPYQFYMSESGLKASRVIENGYGFCVPKAALLAAAARASGVPARLGFADVRNHLTNPRIDAMMEGDDIFRWHAYTSLFLDGKWVKATPAFDIRLCQRHKVKPLDFNGRDDSIFHEFDENGRKHMEYVRFIGEFDDMPYEEFSSEMRKAYPRMLRELAEIRAARASRKAG